MTDLITRLRKWCISTEAVPASDLMDEAADEVARLRSGAVESRETGQCPYVTGGTTKYCTLTPFTLTDEERESVEFFAKYGRNEKHAATLRGLLERLSSPAT